MDWIQCVDIYPPVKLRSEYLIVAIKRVLALKNLFVVGKSLGGDVKDLISIQRVNETISAVDAQVKLPRRLSSTAVFISGIHLLVRRLNANTLI